MKCRQIEPVSRLRPVASECLNISSKGLVFVTKEAFQLDKWWKRASICRCFLDSRVGLTLVVEGEVVRKSGDQTAIHFEKYGFQNAAG